MDKTITLNSAERFSIKASLMHAAKAHRIEAETILGLGERYLNDAMREDAAALMEMRQAKMDLIDRL